MELADRTRTGSGVPPRLDWLGSARVQWSSLAKVAQPPTMTYRPSTPPISTWRLSYVPTAASWFADRAGLPSGRTNSTDAPLGGS